MRAIIIYGLGLLAIFATCFSCVEEQDFGQIDNLDVIPTVEASLLYVEAPEDLVNAVAGANVISRDFNFDAFSEDVFAERVIDGTITYIVQNTTSKELGITIELLDADDNVLDTEIIDVDAPEPELIREVFYGAAGKSIDIIRNTSSIRVTATNEGDNSSVSELPDPKIILKSSGRFRVELIQ